MEVNRIIKQYKWKTWCEFSKNYKKKYAEENKRPLTDNFAEHITYHKITKRNNFGFSKELVLKEPDIEDTLPLLILGNDNYSEDEALEDAKLYLDENPNMGLLGLHLELSIMVLKQLNISPIILKTCIELRDKYIASIGDKDNKDTQEE